MRKEDIQRGRRLSLLLRHEPHLLRLKMDKEGWVDIDQLVSSWQSARWRPKLSLDDLNRLVAENDKQRYTLDLEGNRIRARQGHSVSVDLGLEALEPPAKLFHGTVKRFISAIKDSGLLKGSRQHVHLSQDIDTASRVGKRRGKPIILVINSARMHVDGHSFYLSDNKVWLVDSVPEKYIEFPEY